jgi:hypothetical protein
MMKKNILKLDVLLICAAALLASCSGIPGKRSLPENPGMLTITGIPEEFDGKLVDVSVMFHNADPPLVVREPDGRQRGNSLELIVYDGELKLPFYKQGVFELIGYSGSDTYDILFSISAGDIKDNSYYYASIIFESVRFENGAATVNWNRGDVDWVMKPGKSIE